MEPDRQAKNPGRGKGGRETALREVLLQSRFYVSLYIMVPVIFAGLATLAAIVLFRVTEYRARQGLDFEDPIFFWLPIGFGLLAFLCGLVIVYLLLRPVQNFLEKARRLPALSGSAVEDRPGPTRDRLDHYREVLSTVSDVLGRVEARDQFPEITGESRAMRAVLGQIIKVAPTEATVLILGESGTGKELVATSLYAHSKRRERTFVKLNCAAIPGELLETELFGHEKGAFTGAAVRKPGKFELADRGTIFMDEVGDLPPKLQGKLLRVLQEREFDRIGGTRPVKVDIRIIAATNKDLETMVRDGRFREDLYYRLNVFALHLPPLRERREDIPLLVDSFLQNAAEGTRISATALQLLMGYEWPGNIRELQNSIERAAVLRAGDVIEAAHLPPNITRGIGDFPGEVKAEPTDGEAPNGSLDQRLQSIEKGMIMEALRQAGGVQVQAAGLLGINPRSLWHRIKKYEIDATGFKPDPKATKNGE